MIIFNMLLFLLLLPLILSPAFGESIPNYDDPYAPIFTDKPVYTWTDKIKMTILSPSWNTDTHLIDSIGNTEDHPIKVGTSDYFLKPYRFTETDVNSGIFTAEITLTGFSHDVDGDGDVDTNPRTFGNGPTSGFLEVDRDSAITISFEFANGVVLTKSIPVSWNLGTINFLNEPLFSDNSVTIRVVDVDMNLNPESIDHLPIHVLSDSDVAGITVNAIETSENSGYFVAIVSLSQDSPSSGNRLYVLSGDEIYAKYVDHTLPKPFSKSDNLEIKTFTSVNSSILPLERLNNSPPKFSDSFGNTLESFSSNVQMQIVGTIKNDHTMKQKFVYIFQVKNSDNYVESISWIQGELLSKQSLDVSQSWIPPKSGVYEVETFVWNSFDNPMALSPLMSTVISVE